MKGVAQEPEQTRKEDTSFYINFFCLWKKLKSKSESSDEEVLFLAHAFDFLLKASLLCFQELTYGTIFFCKL